MKTITKLIALSHLFCAISVAGLNNSDVIEMHQAGLDTETIIMSIRSSETDFDTSAKQLIQLKNAKVPEEIIQMMINPGRAATAVDSGASSEGGIDPEIVTLVTDSGKETMQYTIPTMRTTARAFGFGGVATYTVLRGSHASLRLSDSQPSFIVSVPARAQPEAYIDLASFAVRDNNSREVLVGGGYMGYSTGIHPDRRIGFTAGKLADQSDAREGFVLCEVTPTSALAAGEYALILYNAEITVVGFFGHGSNSCFDFSVQ